MSKNEVDMPSRVKVLTIIKSEFLKAIPVDAEIQLILLADDGGQEFKTFEIRIILGGHVFALKEHYIYEHEALAKYEEILEESKKSPEDKEGDTNGPAHKGT